MLITLTPDECRRAAEVGLRRRLFSMGRHNKDCYAPSTGMSWWDRDIEASGAELAAAKALGLDWEPRVGDFHCSDLEVGYEVRHTPYPNGHLIIRPHDKPGTYILVTGKMPVYEIVGHADADEVKRALELSMGPTNRGEQAYWVPQEVLEGFKA